MPLTGAREDSVLEGGQGSFASRRPSRTSRTAKTATTRGGITAMQKADTRVVVDAGEPELAKNSKSSTKKARAKPTPTATMYPTDSQESRRLRRAADRIRCASVASCPWRSAIEPLDGNSGSGATKAHRPSPAYDFLLAGSFLSPVYPAACSQERGCAPTARESGRLRAGGSGSDTNSRSERSVAKPECVRGLSKERETKSGETGPAHSP